MFKFMQAWLSFFNFYVVDGEGGALEGDAITDAFVEVFNPKTDAEAAEAEEKTLAEKAKALAEPAEADPEEAQSDDEKVTVEIDGKTMELTKEQIAEAYKNGLRQDDYSRKTMAAAEERKAAEAEKQKATTERQAYAEKLNTYAIQLQGMLAESESINWDALREADPLEYLRQKDLVEKRQTALYQAGLEKQQIDEINQIEAAQAKQSYLQTQQQELIAKLPAWKDEAKAKAEKAELKDYLRGQGFTDQDISMIEDHRSVLVVRNAMLFDKLMKQAPSATKRVTTAPLKVEAPGVSNEGSDARTKLMKQVRSSKTLTPEQAGNAFSQLL
ncbi:MAG: hypothetical protein V4605_09575 [Pseudomonadota bacterium]